MRWTVRTIVVVAVLWIGFTTWPLFALYDLVKAVQHRDVVAVNHRINFPALRRSLTEQITRTYLKLTGRDARLGQFGQSVAVAAASSIADPIVSKLLSADTVVELLADGWPTALLPEKSAPTRGLSPHTLGSVWQIYLQSEQGLRTFDIAVPTTVPKPLRFKLRFRLAVWTWKLVDVELPEELRLRLAQELVKQVEKK
jgi:hypothetical protein